MSGHLPNPHSDLTPSKAAHVHRLKNKLMTAPPKHIEEIKTENYLNIYEDTKTAPVINKFYDESDTIPEFLHKHTINHEPVYKDPLDAISAYLTIAADNEDISILGSFGKLTFKAAHVCINSYGVAFIVKKDAMQFEPNVNTELTIIYRQKHISVLYAGGFFTFDKIPFTFISFMRITEEND